MNNKPIENISEFISALPEYDKTQNVFFRGHSDAVYELIPGIYRNDANGNPTHLKYEDKMYREIIAKAPLDFVGKNTLESLALMQHYGLPTRILDLTENPLVALYFACSNNQDKDGEVLIFISNENNTCNYNSDKITILSNLAKCECNFQYEYDSFSFIERELDILNKELHSERNLLPPFFPNTLSLELEDFLKFIRIINETIDKLLAGNEYFQVNSIHSLIEDVTKKSTALKELYFGKKELCLKEIYTIKTNCYEHLINFFNQKKTKEIVKLSNIYFEKLIHNIKEDKPFFQSKIIPSDINKVFFVKPKMDNPRIIKQQGAFLIFGIKPYNNQKRMAEIQNKNNITQIKIDHKSKTKILKTLSTLGIDEVSLFPEMEYVAKDIKVKYNV